MIHSINIGIHIIAGSVALVLGIILLLWPKGGPFHKKFGKVFVWILAIVCGTGFLGWLFFRSNAFLLMLTLLAGYNTFAGFRIIKLKQQRSSIFDALVAMVVLSVGLCYMSWLMNSDTIWNKSVIYSTLGGIVLVTSYDISKYFYLHRWTKTWWLYEHIYKIISSFSAIFSAFIGTVLPNYKPFSQIVPSFFCVMLIVVFIWRNVNRRVVI
jgi:uncharacterized membrane protein